MIAVVTDWDTVPFTAYCQQTIPAMEESGIAWPAHITENSQKCAALEARCREFLTREDGLVFQTANGMLGVGYWEGQCFRLIMTFYTQEGAAFAFEPFAIQEWIGWLQSLGAKEIVAPIPPGRKESAIALFEAEADDIFDDGHTVRLWAEGRGPFA